MASPRQKDTIKTANSAVEPKSLYVPKEPMRFKLKKTRLIDIDDRLKRLYRIKN